MRACTVAQSYLTLVTLWTVACKAPLSMRLSKQEYGHGLPFPSLGDRPDPGFPELAGRFFTAEPPRKPTAHSYLMEKYL